MSTATAKPALKSSLSVWAGWVGIAVVATLAGLALPQMMTNDPVVAKAPAKSESNEKSSLEYTAPTLPEAPNLQAMMVRLAVGTIIVLGLCVVSLWGMKRWLVAPGQPLASDRNMHLLETLNLGNRCCLHLVHLGKREVLIGVDSGGIKAVLPLAEPFVEVLDNTQPLPIDSDAPAAPRLAA